MVRGHRATEGCPLVKSCRSFLGKLGLGGSSQSSEQSDDNNTRHCSMGLRLITAGKSLKPPVYLLFEPVDVYNEGRPSTRPDLHSIAAWHITSIFTHHLKFYFIHRLGSEYSLITQISIFHPQSRSNIVKLQFINEKGSTHNLI